MTHSTLVGTIVTMHIVEILIFKSYTHSDSEVHVHVVAWPNL